METTPMSPPKRADDRTDRGAFETELREPVARAQENGVSIAGAYNARSPR